MPEGRKPTLVVVSGPSAIPCPAICRFERHGRVDVVRTTDGCDSNLEDIVKFINR
jgi:hypothetical protein